MKYEYVELLPVEGEKQLSVVDASILYIVQDGKDSKQDGKKGLSIKLHITNDS